MIEPLNKAPGAVQPLSAARRKEGPRRSLPAGDGQIVDTGNTAACDVLVLGSGPAGIAAAITAARLGLSATLVCPRHAAPLAPAETVPAGFPETLARLGIRAAGLCRRARVLSPQAEILAGWHVDRHAVDRALLRTAVRAGVAIRRDSAEAPLDHAGRIVGLQLDRGGPLHSKMLIDATGSAGWLRRQLELRRVALSDPMIAARGQVRGHLPALGADGMAFTPDPGGWTYLVAHGGRISWTALCVDGRRPECPDSLAAMPELIAASHWPVGWQLIRPLAGEGWLIAGEAAGRVDPAGGSGLTDALAGGARAAHAAALCIGNPAGAAAARLAYDDWYADLITARAAELTRRYALHGIRLDRHQMRRNAA